MPFRAEDVREFYSAELKTMRHIVRHSEPPTSSTPVYAPNHTTSQYEAERLEANRG